MSIIERFNVENLNKIIEKQHILRRNKYSLWTNTHNVFKHINLLTILPKYLNNVEKNEQGIYEPIGSRLIEYVPSQKNKKFKGRVYPKNGEGLIAFPKYIRNYLLTDHNGEPLVIDVDIVNCHNVLYLQYLLKQGYPKDKLTYFSHYIDNRQDWFDNYGREIKDKILCVLNCGDIFESDEEELQELYNEIQNSHRWIMNQRHFGLKELKTFIHNTLTEIERDIIDNAIEFIKFTTGLDIEIYAYDGFCIPNTDLFKTHEGQEYLNTILTEMSEYCSLNTGYNCQFIFKPIKNDPKLLELMNSKPQPLENSQEIQLSNGVFLGNVVTTNVFDLPANIICMKIFQSAGKSNKVAHDIKSKPGSTAIFIYNRISLIDNMTSEYPHINSYLDEDGKNITKIDGYKKFTAICCESLHKLTPETAQNIDYLIIDEIMSLIPQLQTRETHRENLFMNQNFFWGLVKNAKKVVLMDANLDQSTIDLIKTIRGGGLVKTYTCQPYKKRNIIYHNNRNEKGKYDKDKKVNFLKCIKKEILNGKKLFMTSTTDIDNLTDFCKDLEELGYKCLFINRYTRTEYQQFIKDTNRWVEFDLVICSPTITSGVSCVVRDHFDEVYCLFSKNTLNAMDSSQMIGRVRYPKSHNIHIFIEDIPNKYYNLPPMTEDEIIKKLVCNTYDLYTKNRSLFDIKFDFTTFREELVMNHRTKLFIHNQMIQSFQYKCFELCLKDALENSFICNYTYLDEKVKDITIQIGITKELKCNEILDAEPITREMCFDLEKEQKTNDPRYIKYKILHQLKVPNFEQYLEDRVITARRHTGTQILNHINSNIIPNVKTIRNIVYGFKPRQDCSICPTDVLNPLVLNDDPKEDHILLNSNLDFETKELNGKEFDTNDLLQIWRGQKIKALWVQDILQNCFGSQFLYQQLEITHDEFKIGCEKFVELLKNGRYRERGRKSLLPRLIEIFDLKMWNSQLKKWTTGNIRMILNKQFLNNVGLKWEGLGAKTIINEETKTQQRVNEKYRLQLIEPVRLERSLPLKMDDEYTTNIPTLIMEEQSLLRPQRVLSETELNNYYNSVFYHCL